jgi:4-hydroxybenzoate polyprenyltransferase
VSRTERIKEEIGWLKVVLTLMVAIDASLVAWLAQNYQTAQTFLVVLGFVGVVLISAAIVCVSIATVRLLRSLEDE